MDDVRAIGRLIASYHAAHYDVRCDGHRYTIRIGHELPAALVAWLGTSLRYAFISACNPRSQWLSPALNPARQHELLDALRAPRARLLAATGRMPGESWREPSLFVADIDTSVIDVLARRFDQNGIVWGTVRGPALLRLYRSDWRGRVPGDPTHIVWAPPDPLPADDSVTLR
jgi:hypothetical protein